MITTVQQKTEEDFELLPDPERIVNGLRDTGYNFNTAVADIVDNSIAANATKINIEVNMDPNMQVKVYFADNGCGMDLQTAWRFTVLAFFLDFSKESSNWYFNQYVFYNLYGISAF